MEEKIRTLWALPDEERLEVEKYVDEHGDERPELREALEDARRWQEFLRDARALDRDPPGEDALAFYTVMRKVQAERAPEWMRDALERLDQKIAADPALRRRLAEMEQRGIDLDRASNAGAQFRRLVAEVDPEMRPRAPARGLRVLRRVAAVTAIAAAAYGLLFVAGRLMLPETARIARFDASELRLEGYDQMRGGAAAGPERSTSEPVSAYLQALEHLRAAQTGVLGLFPGFDQARLDSAATHLERVIATEPPESFLASEAHYLLGKTELARGNLRAARAELEQVDGLRRPDASALLSRLAELQPPESSTAE